MPYKPIILDEDGKQRVLPDGETVVGSGDMYKEVYDPSDRASDEVSAERPVPGDIFDRRNHHNQITVSDVEGLGTAAVADIGIGADDVASGDHIHLVSDPDMLSAIYDPQDWGLATPSAERPVPGDIFDRRNHYGIIQAGTVEGMGTAGAANIGDGPDDVASGDHTHEQEYLLTATYDPTGIAGNAFDRSKHTGSQPASTITGLGAGALLNIGTTEKSLAAGDHTHEQEYLLTATYDPTGIAGNAFDRSKHTGSQLLGTIQDADMVGATSSTVGRKGVVPAPVAGQELFFLRGDGQWADHPVTGVMTTAVYDSDGDGVLDNATKLGGQNSAYYLNRARHTGSQKKDTISGLEVFELTANKNVANGYAGLDASGKLNTSQLPTAIASGLKPKGLWDATTSLPEGTYTDGDFYRVSVSGTTSVNGINDWVAGDWLIYENSAWTKLDNTDIILTVNGYRGDVILELSDIVKITNPGTPNQVLQFNGDGWVSTNALVGDMLKSVYDTTGNGVVDDSERLGNELPAFYLNRANHDGDIDVENIDGIGPVAAASFGTGENDVASGSHTHDDYLKKDNNLSDVAVPAIARTNLGLTSMAVAKFGTTTGTVSVGSHTHSIKDLADLSQSTTNDIVYGFMQSIAVERGIDYEGGFEHDIFETGDDISAGPFTHNPDIGAFWYEGGGSSGYIRRDYSIASGESKSAYIVVAYASNITLNTDSVPGMQVLVSNNGKGAGEINKSVDNPPFDAVTMVHQFGFSSGIKVAAGVVDLTGTDGNLFWKVNIQGSPADFALYSVLLGHGTKTKSYLNVEETRTKQLNLTSYTELVKDHGDVSGYRVLNRADGNVHKIVVTSAVTLSFVGFVADRCTTLTLFVTNGGENVNFAPTIEWLNGAGEIMFKTNGTDLLNITSLDGGSTYYASYVQ